MNPLAKKEIRLLLPNFVIGCVLAVSNLLQPQNSNSIFLVLPFLFCPAIVVMLALNSFGAEVSSGNFSSLLALPVSRLKIWQTKILLLAISLLIIGVLYSAAIILRAAMIHHSFVFGGWLFHLLTPVTVFELVAFSGGLWTVLLLRQVAAAFWFTVLVPGVILVIFGTLFGNEFVEGVAVVILGIYSLCGLFFARWLFLRAQDSQWPVGTITMPEVRGLARFKAGSGAHRAWRPRMALFIKELQLHQSQLVIVGVLFLLHLGVIATRKFGHFRKDSSLEVILEFFWGLWLLMPLLIGCATVAEERKNGTLESQLCLPAKRRTQFSIKLFFVLALSVLLGAFIPLLLEGTKILPNVHFELNMSRTLVEFGYVFSTQIPVSTAQILFENCLATLNFFLPLLTLAGIAVVIGAISFHASTLARNTLQSLTTAMAGILVTWFLLFAASRPDDFNLGFLWHGWLVYLIAVPAMSLTLLALAFGNFKRVLVGWKMWWRNFFALAFALTLAVAATSAIYHRFWEKFTPFAPPHGAARLALSNPTSLSEETGEVSVRLPDGTIWMSFFQPDPTTVNPLGLILSNFKVVLNDGKFISGSNWLSVKRSVREWIGIRKNGTLWSSEKPLQVSRLQNDKWKVSEEAMYHLVQFGNETNWNSVVPVGWSALLVKEDGTLWRWGVANFDLKYKQWPGLRAFTPYRLGMESNWAEIFQDNHQMCLRKQDGSIWTWSGSWNTNGKALLDLEPGFTMVQSAANQGHGKFRSTALVSHGLEYKVGVRDDGTFRICADMHLDKQRRSYELSAADLQIGNGTNWLAVAGGGSKVVTLTDDGSLWLWDFRLKSLWRWDPSRFEEEIRKTVPVRLGTHSDWVAISGSRGYATALAADGSLWYWPLEQTVFDYNYDNSVVQPLLDISHKPQFLGNVFGKAD